MSGALARTLGTASAVGSVLSLLTGGSVVTLDDIEFQSFEVPEAVQFGGAQQTTMHEFPGGARVIDSMGAREGQIAWSGIMLGLGGSDRVQQLDELRQSGDQVTLTWGDFSRTVVVTSCTFDNRYEQIRYSIQCEVVPDGDDGTGGVAPSPLAQIGDDINSAAGFDLTGDVTTGLTAASAIVAPAVGVLAPSASASLSSTLATTSLSLLAVQKTAETTMAAAADPVNVVSGPAALLSALGGNQSGAAAADARGYLSRASLNNGGGPLMGL